MAPRPPYLDPAIDRWKLVVLLALFVVLLVGALTWYGDSPWGSPAERRIPSLPLTQPEL